MPKRFHAGHGIVVGTILGLLLAQHVFVVAALALALGIALGRTWGTIVKLAPLVRQRFGLWYPRKAKGTRA